MTDSRFVSGVENLYGQCHANGSISAGDAVKLDGEKSVVVVDTSGEDWLGVAMYSASSGEAVAVALVGAVVRVNCNGSSVSAGDLLTPEGATNGRLDTAGTTGDTQGAIAITAGGTPNSNECIAVITGPSGEQN